MINKQFYWWYCYWFRWCPLRDFVGKIVGDYRWKYWWYDKKEWTFSWSINSEL